MQTVNEYIIHANWYESIFLLIEFINLTIFIFAGIKISNLKNEKAFWKYALYPIISYSICEGLRFGRAIDYNLYYNAFIQIGEDFNETNHEILFKIINWLIYNIGLPYQTLIFACSLFLITVVMLLIKEYKEVSLFALLFFILESKDADNYIRWYFSFSFFLLSYLYLIKNRYIVSIIYAICSIFIHVGVIILYPILWVIVKFKRPILKEYIVFFLFLITLTLGEANILEFLIPYADIIFSLTEKTQVYANNFEDLIQGNWDTGYMTIPLTTSIKYFIAYSFPLFYYPKIINNNNKYNYIPYNLFCIGLILFPIFNTIELFDRYSKSLMFFSIIVSSVTFYYSFRRFKLLTNYEKLFCTMSFIAATYSIISFFFNDHLWFYTLFIWDAGEFNTLPIWIFK